MSTANLVAAAGIAVAFASWPIIGRYSQTSGSWVSTIVFLGTTAMIVLLSGKQLTTSFPSGKALAILVIAGIMNGAACYYYAVKLADPAIPASTFVVLTIVTMVVVTPLLDWALNGAVPTPRQIAGFGCVTAAIYLLKG